MIQVIGDILIDYRHQVTKTKNPESQKPLYKITETKTHIGGVANIHHHLKNLSCKHRFFGTYDNAHKALVENHGVNTQDLRLSEGMCIKSRYFLGNRYINRIDQDCTYHTDSPFPLKKDQLTIISDYRKGTICNLNPQIIKNSIVDTKASVLEEYKSCLALKLNELESRVYSKKPTENLKELAKYSDNIVITRSNKGIYVFSKGKIEKFKLPAINPTNIIGAGDSFHAALGFLMSVGYNFIEACEKAYLASHNYVQKEYFRPLELKDLCAYKKLLLYPQILQHSQRPIIFTNGCFDLLHEGHRDCLRYAKNQDGILVVAVNSDESVKLLKGPSRPIETLENRLTALSNLSYVDFVIPFCEQTPLSLIEAIKPKIIVKGAPYRADEVVGSHLAKVVICPKNIDISTTQLIASKGDIYIR